MGKRVLIYSTAYLPLVGGAEIAVKEIADRLGDYSFDLVTARLDHRLPKEEKLGRVKIYRLGWGWAIDKLWLAMWGGSFGRRLHANNPYDIVWGIMASFGGLAALRFKELVPGVKFVLTLQEGDDLTAIENKMKFLAHRFKKIFTKADHIQAISNYLAAWAKRRGALAPIEVVPNGVDLDKFKFVERQNNRTIITTSRLVKKNGVDTLVRSLLFLPAEYRLQIFGTGPEIENLRVLTLKFKLAGRVDFLGLIENDKLPLHLAKAEVFARPSRSEGLGNSFLEAMACGLPVVGTPVGGIPDFLINGQTGWLCELDSPFDLAEKIKLITNPENADLVKRVIIQARQLIADKYDWNKIALKMDQIFSNV
ncbi:MAG: glycosyltransferase family 4 protein [Candidatus Paceibacterota bacterium]|jgi:glycosyltransferase involved in cell wall biosynthesis